MIEQTIILDNVDVAFKTENGEIKDVISIRMKINDEKEAYLEKNEDGSFKLTWHYHTST